MHLITLFLVMNSHQRCLQAKVKYRNEPKQVMPKSVVLSRLLEIDVSICSILYRHITHDHYVPLTVLYSSEGPYRKDLTPEAK